MKKKLIVCVLIVALVALGIIIGNEIGTSKEEKELLQALLGEAYTSLSDISTDLDAVILECEKQDPSLELCKERFSELSLEFNKLHYTFKSFATAFPPKGTSRNVYAGIVDFETISNVLVYADGEINGSEYKGILNDNAITQKEIRFLSELNNDIGIMKISMETKDEQPKLNEALSSDEMDRILETFFENWDWSSESSPMKLLAEA